MDSCSCSWSRGENILEVKLFKSYLFTLDYSGDKLVKIVETQLKFEGLELSIPLWNGRNSWSLCGRTGVDPTRGPEWIQPEDNFARICTTKGDQKTRFDAKKQEIFNC